MRSIESGISRFPGVKLHGLFPFRAQLCADSSSPPIGPVRSRISVKQAYIRVRNDVHGAPPGCGPPSSNPHSLPQEPKRLRSETMRPFSYDTAAELFPAAIRKKKRAGFAYRRFGTAAEAG